MHNKQKTRHLNNILNINYIKSKHYMHNICTRAEINEYYPAHGPKSAEGTIGEKCLVWGPQGVIAFMFFPARNKLEINASLSDPLYQTCQYR